MIEVMIKVAAGAVTAAVCATVVRRGTPELGFLLALAAGIWVLWTVADSLKLVTDWMKWLCELAGLEDWLAARSGGAAASGPGLSGLGIVRRRVSCDFAAVMG